jgi:hypothetical protein
MFLSKDELIKLTGYRRPSYQRRWLRHRGWAFEIGADKRPKVLREHARRQPCAVDSRRPPRLHLPPDAISQT